MMNGSIDLLVAALLGPVAGLQAADGDWPVSRIRRRRRVGRRGDRPAARHPMGHGDRIDFYSRDEGRNDPGI